jgi:OmpA-OmpF porin, OOP family
MRFVSEESVMSAVSLRTLAVALPLLMAAAATAAPTPVGEIVKTFKDAPAPVPAEDEDSLPVGKERAFDFLSTAKPRTASPAAGSAVASSQPARSVRPVARPARMSKPSLDMRLEFASGSAELSEAARAEARQFANALRTADLAPMRFAVEGHTDAVGDREYNLDLSRRRAQAVVDFMVQQGVDPARLQPQGYGFDKPRFNAPQDPRNRRVEFARVG